MAMSNDKRKPASWKNPGAGAGNGPAPSQKREWHPTTTKAAKPAGPRRRSVLWPVLAAAVLLGLIVAAVLLWKPPRLPRVVVAGPANADTLSTPQNVAGAKAARGLADWINEGRDRPHLAAAPAESLAGDEWARGLDEGNEKSVALALNLHGGVDSSGEPFLWVVPPDAPEPADSQKLRISTVLTRLGQLPEKKRKLLILDATQVPVSYAHGQLHNDFARALKRLDKQITAVPGLVVLASSDDDQRSWVSEQWQKSIFAQLVLEAARGAAGVDRVTVEELYKFLQTKLPAWTLANRGEKQTPLLLPLGDEGLRRAAQIDFASVSSSRYEKPDPRNAPGASFNARDLAGGWERRDELAKLRPEAVAPHRWRVHLDTLLRIERMYRDGLPIADVQARLAQLAKAEEDLKGKPWPELSSLGNSLPMPAALGPQPALNPADADAFPVLWDEAIHDRPGLRQTAESKGVVTVARRLDICAKLIQHLINDGKPEDLPKAARLLDALFVGSEPAPVEAQLIRILARDLDAAQEKRPPWDLVKLGLRLQVLAEQAAVVGGAGENEFPASEQVFPWIMKDVIAADDARLKGLDCLISNDPASWPKGEGLLKSADEQYRAILKRAKEVRDALTERNSALIELPYYGRWVAGLRGDFGEREGPKLLDLVERTAAATHRLSVALEEANPASIGEMSSATTATHKAMEELRDRFLDFTTRLNGKVQISTWHDIDNALQVPFIEAKRRVELLGYLRGIEHSLNVNWESAGDSPASAPAGSAREAAKRQGRVALALLGSAWVNDPRTREESGGAVKATFDELQKLVTTPAPEWWQSLNDAGDQIGRHWRALARRVDELTDKATRATLDRALPELAHADMLARMADSTCAFGKERDPVVDHRRHRLHAFLLAQARRSIEANWGAAELVPQTSYAQVTGERFVNDAERLIKMGAGPNPTQNDLDRLLVDVKPTRAALKIADWGLTGELNRDWTPELQTKLDLKFTVRRPAGRGPGYPVLHFEAAAPVLIAPALTARQPINDFADLPDAPPTAVRGCAAGVDAKAVASGAGMVTAELWHRGHRIRTHTQIGLNREPTNILAYNPPVLDPKFAVKTTPNLRSGAVAILLDWSLSMNSKDATNTTRYHKAVAGLKAVLKSLPPNTHVSITLFPGTAGGYSEMIEKPLARDFKNNDALLDDIIEKLQAKKPAGEYTPAARAIVEAAKNGLPPNFPGYQTVVVLTDGDDNTDYGNAGKYVKDALANTGIALKMIFFQASPDEYKNARRQFEAVELLDPPGQLVAADDQESLRVSLVDAMRPRVKTFLRTGEGIQRLPGDERNGLPVTLAGSRLRDWARVQPGNYLVKIANVEGKLRFLRGDRLILDLVRAGDRVEFRPHLFIPDALPPSADKSLHVVSDDGQNIHAALANFKLVHVEGARYDLEMTLLLEREGQADELEVTHPQFVWVEVGTQNDRKKNDAKEPVLVTRLENEPYYPAPAFKVRVNNWRPLPDETNVALYASRPTLTIWRSSGLPGGPIVLTYDEDAKLDGQTFSIDNGKQIKIDSVKVENDYLRVQLTHDAGNPLVYLRASNRKGGTLNLKEEHRYYADKGLYTATFGPLNASGGKPSFSLSFHSLAKIKEGATRLEMRPNITPRTNDLFGQATPAPEVRDN
jgi:hypothetical protein